MTYGWGVFLGLGGYALLGVLLRPYGDRVLLAAAGGTRTGAFLVGLLLWAVPVLLGAAWALRRHLHRGRSRKVPGSRALGTACLVSAVPLTLVPLLGSRSASDTPFEVSPLFEPWLAGFAVGMALLLVVLLALRLVGAWPEDTSLRPVRRRRVGPRRR